MEKAQAVLVWVMRGMLKLLHPFMPYITEEIWQVLTDGESMIIVESYPVYDTKYDFADAAQFEKVIDAIRASATAVLKCRYRRPRKHVSALKRPNRNCTGALRYSLRSWRLLLR